MFDREIEVAFWNATLTAESALRFLSGNPNAYVAGRDSTEAQSRIECAIEYLGKAKEMAAKLQTQEG